MSVHFDRAFVESLGLRLDDEHRATVVSWPVEPVGEGLSRASSTMALTDLVAAGFPGLRFDRVGIDLLEARGARLDVLRGRAGIVRFVGASSEPVSARISPLGAGEALTDREDPGTVYFDAAAALTTVLQQGDLTCVVAAGASGLEIAVASEIPSDGRSVPAGDTLAPLEQWLVGCPDQWLVTTVMAMTSTRSWWTTTVAAGIMARLWSPQSKVERLETIRRLLGGEPVAELDRPRQWARSWTADRRAVVREHALSAIERLTLALSAAKGLLATGDNGHGDVHALCVERDDLESVLALLQLTGLDEELARRVRELDQDATLWIGERPTLRLDDERLRRASIGDPAAWWARPSVR